MTPPPSPMHADVSPTRLLQPSYSLQWFILGIALLLLGAEIGLSQIEARKRIESEARNRLENHSLIVAEELERRTLATRQVLDKLRDKATRQLTRPDGPGISSPELGTLALALEGVRTLIHFDAKGNVLASSRSELVGKNFAHRAYFQDALKDANVDTFYLSAPFITALDAYTMTLTRMIPGPRGEFAGIVTATMDSDSIGTLLHSIHAGSDTTLSVMHGNGTLVVLSPKQEGTPPGLSVNVPGSFYQRHMASGKAASLMSGHAFATGRERLLSMRTLQPGPLHMSSALIISAARDIDEILAPWRAEAISRAVYFLLLAAGAALLLFMYQHRQKSFASQILQIEEESQRSQLILQRFIDNMPGTAYVKDADSRTLMASHGFKTVLGMDPSAMIGKTSLELFPGEFGRKITEDDRKILENGNTVVLEEAFNGRDFESTKFVIDDGRGHRLLGGMTMDITARKQMERQRESQLQALRDLNQKLAATEDGMRHLSTAVEQSPASIVITDLNARIIFVNEAFTQASGYTAEEAMGQNPKILHSGETPPEIYRQMWPTLQAGKVWRGEFINQRKDGSQYLELATISPIRDDNGQVTHYVAIKEDITEKRRNENELLDHRRHLEKLVEQRTHELAEAKDRADAANRAKSEFLANMSHEIRTPMNAIIGLNYLLQQSPLQPAQLDKLSKVSGAAQHLLQIINDILDLSKIEAGKLVLENHAFSLREVLQNIGAMIRDRAAGKGLELHIDSDGLPERAYGDVTRLRQILLNFASNALKFTDEGSISISGELLSREGNQISCRFSVSDTGIGIRPDDTSRLFNAFEQLDSSTTRCFGGTGLGLAIARHLAELMGGEVGVESTLGVGSRFWITARLGLASGEAASDPGEPGSPLATHPAKRLKGRVLVVEDEPTNREIASDLLTNVGLNVVTAENGRQAVDCYRQSDIDLILMDIQMPELNGLDASREIRALEKGRHVPIIALSANVFSADRENCRAAGMNDFLAKPVLPDALHAVLAKYLPAANDAIVTPPAPEKDAGAEQACVTSLLEEIDKLAELLKTGDIEATHLFNRLHADLKRYCPAECEQLHHRIAIFDFEGTLALIEGIKKR